jgi:hypothetical protein
MTRLILFLVVVAAGWYAWHHYGDILHKQPSHEAVIENRTGHEMVRVRLNVDGQGFARESIPDEGTATIPFRVGDDSAFQLIWEYRDAEGEHQWSGGMVPKGPMTQRHIFTVDGEGAVIYRAENK